MNVGEAWGRVSPMGEMTVQCVWGGRGDSYSRLAKHRG